MIHYDSTIHSHIFTSCTISEFCLVDQKTLLIFDTSSVYPGYSQSCLLTIPNGTAVNPKVIHTQYYHLRGGKSHPCGLLAGFTTRWSMIIPIKAYISTICMISCMISPLYFIIVSLDISHNGYSGNMSLGSAMSIGYSP